MPPEGARGKGDIGSRMCCWSLICAMKTRQCSRDVGQNKRKSPYHWSSFNGEILIFAKHIKDRSLQRHFNSRQLVCSRDTTTRTLTANCNCETRFCTAMSFPTQFAMLGSKKSVDTALSIAGMVDQDTIMWNAEVSQLTCQCKLSFVPRIFLTFSLQNLVFGKGWKGQDRGERQFWTLQGELYINPLNLISFQAATQSISFFIQLRYSHPKFQLHCGGSRSTSPWFCKRSWCSQWYHSGCIQQNERVCYQFDRCGYWALSLVKAIRDSSACVGIQFKKIWNYFSLIEVCWSNPGTNSPLKPSTRLFRSTTHLILWSTPS